jgi:membrane-associated phospholipid phosphatase
MGSRRVSALLAALACAAGLLWIWVIAFHTDWGVAADDRVHEAFRTLNSHAVNVVALKVTKAGDVPWFAPAAVLLTAAAALRGGWRLALAAAAVLVGTNVTTQVLQQVTATPRHPFFLPEASWPSGHTTAFAALAVVLGLVAPWRLRWLAELAGAAAVVLMGCSTLVLGTHHLSDLVGAVLVVGLWAGLAAAALRPRERAPVRPALARGLLGIAAVAVIAAALLVQKPVLAGIRDTHAAIAAVAVLAALALVVMTAASLTMEGLAGPPANER